jgi:hypothetical protein
MADARRGLNLAADHLLFHDQAGRRYAYAGQAERAAEPAIDFVQCYDEAVVSYQQSRDILKTPRVTFEPLERVDGFTHVILRNGQLLGRWRAARKTRSIEVRLADVLSPAEDDLLTARVDALREFLLG